MEPKSAQLLKFNVKPLSLHNRLNAVQEDTIPEELSTLQITGEFSLNQVHEWVSLCLPEVPIKLQEDDVTLYYRNTYVDSMLICKYRYV